MLAVECMLFEPASTLNTGNVVSDKTVTELDGNSPQENVDFPSKNDEFRTVSDGLCTNLMNFVLQNDVLCRAD